MWIFFLRLVSITSALAQHVPQSAPEIETPSATCGSGKINFRVLRNMGYHVIEVSNFDSQTMPESQPAFDFVEKPNERQSMLAPFMKRPMMGPSKQTPDLMVTGTFNAWVMKERRQPYDDIPGTIVANGKLVHTVDSRGKTFYRGGLALLDDGTIRICQPSRFAPKAKGHDFSIIDMKAIASACGNGSQKVLQFIGGGALLALRGRKPCTPNKAPCDEELNFSRQGFGNKFEKSADVFRSALHVTFAAKGDRTYLVLPRIKNSHPLGYLKNEVSDVVDQGVAPEDRTFYKSGQELQHDLCEAGFESILKFDGGHAFLTYAKNGQIKSSSYPPYHMIRLKLRRD